VITQQWWPLLLLLLHVAPVSGLPPAGHPQAILSSNKHLLATG
jgi:hypothetical protein